MATVETAETQYPAARLFWRHRYQNEHATIMAADDDRLHALVIVPEHSQNLNMLFRFPRAARSNVRGEPRSQFSVGRSLHARRGRY